MPVSADVPSRAEARRARRRRTRSIVVLVTVLVVTAAAAGVWALSRDDGGSARTSTPRGPVTTASVSAPTTAAPTPDISAPPPTTAPPPIDVTRRYAVSTYTAQYVDTTRSTSPNGSFEGAPDRALPTTYWYPAVSDGGAPDRTNGPYPLVLFVHGFGETASFYAPMLERWASAGYVVAGPTFPILSGIPGGASHVDYDKLFGDAAFVISQTLASGADTPIGGLVDGTRIAAAGHSDGEMVSFTLGFAACCREWRIRSVITMAGDLSMAGIDPMRNTRLPILHVMETEDEYDPYQHSIDWDRENLTPPRWMLTLLGARHVPPYTRPGDSHFELLSTAMVDFLDGTLKDRPDRLDQLTTDVAAHADLATVER